MVKPARQKAGVVNDTQEEKKGKGKRSGEKMLMLPIKSTGHTSRRKSSSRIVERRTCHARTSLVDKRKRNTLRTTRTGRSHKCTIGTLRELAIRRARVVANGA